MILSFIEVQGELFAESLVFGSITSYRSSRQRQTNHSGHGNRASGKRMKSRLFAFEYECEGNHYDGSVQISRQGRKGRKGTE